jgi:hypothetical protein
MNSADQQPGGIQTHFETIAKADEGIARQPLSAFHALQEKPRVERRQLEIGRHRRIQISGNVKRWLHVFSAANFQDNKKPITVYERRWVLDNNELV